MTINEFGQLISKAEDAIYENENPKAALIYLHKVLALAEDTAFCAQHAASDEAHRIALANIASEAHERAGQVLGFIQELVREEDRGK